MVEDILYWKRQCPDLDNLIFHGFVSPSEAEVLRNRFDILLAPYQQQVSVKGGGNSVDWMSPLKVFEYMAARKPIICSDLPVLREILDHEQNALLCRADDVGAWEKCMIRLRDQVSLRNRLATNAYRDLMTYYTWNHRAGKILKSLDIQ
jgi:glycosyltransferase involved in cell wall biosynthesis